MRRSRFLLRPPLSGKITVDQGGMSSDHEHGVVFTPERVRMRNMHEPARPWRIDLVGSLNGGKTFRQSRGTRLALIDQQ